MEPSARRPYSRSRQNRSDSSPSSRVLRAHGELEGRRRYRWDGVKLLGRPGSPIWIDDAGSRSWPAGTCSTRALRNATWSPSPTTRATARLAPVLIDEYRKDGACDFDEEEPLTLLAAGDLDGDGLGDYIDGRGVHRGKVGEPFAHVASPDARWSSALIEDLNADGILDGIAGQRDRARRSRSSRARATRHAVEPCRHPDAAPDRRLRLRVFDNDAVRDVAVIERSAFDPMAPSSTTATPSPCSTAGRSRRPKRPFKWEARHDPRDDLGGSVRTSALLME
jgi:hypothetical protein